VTNLLKTLNILESRYADSSLNLEYDEQQADANITIANNALESILANLFDNSLHHGATHIAINTQKKNGRLEISIHDNGTGISKANHSKIFTPFFTTRRESGGTGLGLGIIESIMKASNGTIENISVEKGALFVLSLRLE
jgi:signal transduction histidine kinase